MNNPTQLTELARARFQKVIDELDCLVPSIRDRSACFRDFQACQGLVESLPLDTFTFATVVCRIRSAAVYNKSNERNAAICELNNVSRLLQRYG